MVCHNHWQRMHASQQRESVSRAAVEDVF